jgi:transcriptional regulator of acetoin/glycerol metabolism
VKIHPPPLQIDENAPFQHALFGRKEFAVSLTRLLRHSEDNLVIFVDGSWGAGKTTFARMWLAQLRADKQQDAIYYNAYASDYFGDPFVSFSGEILALVKKRLAEADGVPAGDRDTDHFRS